MQHLSSLTFFVYGCAHACDIKGFFCHTWKRNRNRDAARCPTVSRDLISRERGCGAFYKNIYIKMICANEARELVPRQRMCVWVRAVRCQWNNVNLFITPADNHRFVIYCCGVHHFDCGPFFASLLLVVAIDFDPHSLSLPRECAERRRCQKDFGQVHGVLRSVRGIDTAI